MRTDVFELKWWNYNWVFKEITKFFTFKYFQNDLQVLLYKTSISVQTNIYVKTYTSMQTSGCHQDKAIVSDNFKRNLHHFNVKKVEHNQLFHIKMKEDKIIIFCKICGHFNMIILKWLCILAYIHPFGWQSGLCYKKLRS